MTILRHCWMSNVADAEERYGENSEEAKKALDRPCTCMLPKSHKGPHKWTFDGDIVIEIEFPAKKLTPNTDPNP